MKRLVRFSCRVSALGLALLMASATGCESPAQQMRQTLGMINDARLDTAVRMNIAKTGGLEAWAQTKHIDGVAVATLFEQDGGQSLIEQHHRILTGQCPFVSVTSQEPTGVWLEQLDRKGEVLMALQGGEEPAQETDTSVLYGAAVKLRLLAQALTGGAGLLQKDLTLVYDGLEQKGGRMSHKIEVTGHMFSRKQFPMGPATDLLVVWIDAQSFMVHRLWLAYPVGNGKFGYLAANVSDYRKTPQGLVLPRSIEFAPGDQYQQFSESRIMTVEYQYLETSQEPTKQGWLW